MPHGVAPDAVGRGMVQVLQVGSEAVDESDAWDRAGQTLSRRELRALRGEVPTAREEAPGDAVVTEVDEPRDVEQPEATGPVPTDPTPAVEGSQDGDGDLEGPQDGDLDPEGVPAPVATAPGDGWQQAVDWSLRHELPRELPPEPDVDDVRWDGPPLPPAPTAAGGGAAPAPARVPVLRTAFAPADPAPVDEEWDDIVAEPQPQPGPEPWADRAPAAPPAPIVTGVPAPAVPISSIAVAPGAPPVDGADLSTGSPARPVAPADELPTLTDLLAGRPTPPAGPAQLGWQGTVRRLTGGLVALRPGPFEQRHRDAITSVQRSLDGPKTIVVINPKGGAHKTTASLLLAATFGQHRGGYTLAWDNNETRGTLGWRSHQAQHHNTAVNLLQDLDRFADPGSARVGDLDNYVRSQGSAQFDVLASDEDAASAASIDAFAFRSLHRTLSRFYRIMVVDTGNNMRASNWQAAIEAADQVVIVSTVREDTAQSAAWAIDALRATGHGDAVRNAVTVLSAPAPRRDDRLATRLHEHFGQLTRTVVDVPYDPSLVGGSPLEIDRLAGPTREAWLKVTAAVADGLQG